VRLGSVVFTVLVLLAGGDAWAQVPECSEDAGYPLATATSPDDPARFVGDCVCFNWAAPAGEVDHYHVFANGALVQSGPARAYGYCAPIKDELQELRVLAVSGGYAATLEPVGEPYFWKWTDLSAEQVCVQWLAAECLDGERIVPCP